MIAIPSSRGCDDWVFGQCDIQASDIVFSLEDLRTYRWNVFFTGVSGNGANRFLARKHYDIDDWEGSGAEPRRDRQ